MNRMFALACLVTLAGVASSGGAVAQDTTFTYQGRLQQSGQAHTGTVDLDFRLYDQLTGGNQVGSTVSHAAWPVSDGLFQVDLDFGAAAFNGQARYLEVVVDGTLLTPRQAVRAAPVAMYALAGNEGPQGPQGDPGPQGPQGPAGVSPFTLDQSTGAIEYQYLNQVFRFVPNPNPDWPPAVLAGHSDNQAGVGAVVAGGGSAGLGNVASGLQAVVSGGGGNLAGGNQATVSGGQGNTAGADGATVGGGVANVADGSYATIAGGANSESPGSGGAIGGGVWHEAIGDYSAIAGGVGNVASGRTAAIGGGDHNAASADYVTISGGKDNAASGLRATVSGGEGNIASGEASTIGGGDFNQVTGAYSTLGGGWTNAVPGTFAVVAGGSKNEAHSHYSSLLGGERNVASQGFATVIGGWFNTAWGYSATVAGGTRNCAGGDYSFAAGYRAKIRPGTFSAIPKGVGCNNVPTSGSQEGDAGTFVWADSTDTNFISTGADQFLIRAGGGVGINTNAPAAPLHVFGNSPYSSFEGQLRLQASEETGAAETGGAISFGGHDGSIPRIWGSIRSVKENATVGDTRSVMRFYTRATGSMVERMRIDSNGVTYNGSGSWATFSDRRLKKNIEAIDNPLQRLLALRGVRFEYRDPARVLGAEGPRLGFIAQDVEEVFPEWVGESEEGYKHVTATGFEALAVEALRELEQRNRQAVASVEAELRAQDARTGKFAAQLAEQAEAIDRLLAVNRQLSERNAELLDRLTKLERRSQTEMILAGVRP